MGYADRDFLGFGWREYGANAFGVMARSATQAFALRLCALVVSLAAAQSWSESPQQKAVLTAEWLLAQKWPEGIKQREVFARPKGLERDDEILFGNDEYGFFVAKEWRLSGPKVEIQLFPPGYRHPLEFAWRKRGEDLKARRRLGVKVFRSPFAELERNHPARLHGRLSMPFITLSWVVGGPHYANLAAFPIVVNRLGEIVWAYVPKWVGRPVSYPMTVESVAPGQFAILYRRKHSAFHIVNADGALIREYSGAGARRPLIFHHSFQYLPESQELITLAYNCYTLPVWLEFVPLFSGPVGWLRLFTLPRRTYAGSGLYRINMVTGDARMVWQSTQSFSLNRDLNVSLINNEADRFQDVRRAADYMTLLGDPFLSRDRDGIQCDVNWTHENTARFYPGKGYLISARNLNRVIMIDERGRDLWSLGMGESVTHPFARGSDGFAMQHDPWLLGDGRVLLFDNNVQYRGGTGFRYLNRVMVVERQKESSSVYWQHRIFRAPSIIRGSVTPLADGRVLAYSPGGFGQAYRFIELKVGERDALGHLAILKLNDYYRSIEARPAWSIGGEIWIGDGQQGLVPAPAKPEELQEGFEHGY